MSHDHTETQRLPNRITASERPTHLWKLQRTERRGPFWAHWGRPTVTVLPNSVRSTRREIERLQEEERARTGMDWEIVPA
jgi:hypothetical protein